MITLVGCDSLLYEKLRASLARSPFCFRRVESLEDGLEPDLLVVPADRLEPATAATPPRIAWGPPALMRSAFLAGCADYLREPWTPEELALRAESVLARQAVRFQFPWGTVRWEGDDLRTPRGTVLLSRRQAIILRALLRARGRPVARSTLAALLGAGADRDSRRVDVHVSAIRRQVRAMEPDAGVFVLGVRGQGYLIR